MFPPRRVAFLLMIWLSGMAACPAQEVHSSVRPEWTSLIDGAPIPWAGIFIAVIVGAALLIQTAFTLRRAGVNPAGFVEAFSLATQAGNYQEAWETCVRWRQTALARMLRPALERIGQGREPVEARLSEQARREQGHILFLLGCVLGCAAVAVISCMIAMMTDMHSVALAAMSPDGPRALALALGNMAILAAAAIAVPIPALVSCFILRARANELLPAAGEQGALLISALPYEEIEGVRIGQDFHAGTMLGDADGAPGKRLQVSKELTTLCPSCNAPVNSTRDFCSNCGQLFTWT